MKVKLFYRDGDNYKCTWHQEIDNDIWKEFLNSFGNESIDNYLDKDFKSDNLFNISDLGLSMYDIPLISEHGESYQDHPFVSVVSYEV